MTFTISNIIESFVEHSIAGIDFHDGVMTVNSEDITVTLAAHTEKCSVLASITKFVGVSTGWSNEDLSRAAE